VEGLKWEVDTFWTARLVIAEIELPDIKYPIELPDWLQSELIMEVTGMEEFSNYRLSVSYEP
jgi:CYTH domain-containing protein